MNVLGLIGYPLEHSFSESYFKEKFSSERITGFEYRNFPIARIDLLPGLIDKNPELIGLNVTIPYKESVISFLDERNELSFEVGAVNTIKILHRGDKRLLKGYNTDVYGFYHSIKPLLSKKNNQAIILGTGGASKAVAYVFNMLNIDCLFVSRNPQEGQIGYKELCHSVMKNFNIIVNTSPVGTFPDVKAFPDIPYDLLTNEYLLYDLVYNPPETEFLRMGKMKGAVTVNGLEMLRLQAERSWEIWTAENGD